MRTLALRIIPGDIQDEAESLIKKIRLDKAAEDPTAEQKRIVDAFHDLNVPVDQLLAYVGHPIEQCSPAELVKLRGIYGAIKEGESTWAEVMENKASEAPPKKDAPKKDAPPPKDKPDASTAATGASADASTKVAGEAAPGTVVEATGNATNPRKRRQTGSVE
jgi:hypothetical protein